MKRPRSLREERHRVVTRLLQVVAVVVFVTIIFMVEQVGQAGAEALAALVGMEPIRHLGKQHLLLVVPVAQASLVVSVAQL